MSGRKGRFREKAPLEIVVDELVSGRNGRFREKALLEFVWVRVRERTKRFV